METERIGFEEWAVVELFGHQRIAGKVSEANIAGGAFVRIDVYNVLGNPIWTRYYGPSAIYSISPTTKEVAIAVSSTLSIPPVHRFELKMLAADKFSEGDIEE